MSVFMSTVDFDDAFVISNVLGATGLLTVACVLAGMRMMMRS